MSNGMGNVMTTPIGFRKINIGIVYD